MDAIVHHAYNLMIRKAWDEDKLAWGIRTDKASLIMKVKGDGFVELIINGEPVTVPLNEIKHAVKTAERLMK
jgi:hypothetical protein